MRPPNRALKIGGLVLAAGAGRRMGTNKMRLRLGDESLLRRATRMAIAGGLSPVVVVLGHEAEGALGELVDLPCETVFNPDFAGPTSGSLHLGLQRLPLEVDAAVVLLGDMVFTTAEMVRSLGETALRTAAPLVVSRYGDVNAPPLLFRRALFPELLAWTGEGCGKAVVQQHRGEAVYLDWPPAALTDVDTPEDFVRARKIIEGSASIDD